MERVLLKSRIGPFECRYRPMEDGKPQLFHLRWTFENDFKELVPEKWWDDFQDKVFDPKSNLRYRDAFLPLSIVHQ